MSSYDLGMLRVFVLVYETGSVTHASERLFISQPSVSYTLRKLRSHFGDSLFQRKGHRLEPTRLAHELYPKLRHLLESLDDLMETPGEFSPSASGRRFRLRMTDVGVSGLLPSVLRCVRSQAPGVTLEVESLNLATVLHDLRTGAADAAISTTRLDESDIRRDLLFNQEYVGLCAANHPRISEAPALGAYEDEEHVAVATSTGHTALDVRARELGINRRVSVVIPTFSSLPDLLADSELVSYAPTSVASRMIRHHEVRSFRLPFDVPVTQVAMYTLRRDMPAADVEWLRATVMSSVQARHTPAPNSVRVAGGFT